METDWYLLACKSCPKVIGPFLSPVEAESQTSVLVCLTPKLLVILSENVGSTILYLMSETFLLDERAPATASPACCIVPSRIDCIAIVRAGTQV